MKIYNRKDKTYDDEVQYQDKKLSFLYKSILGRIILKLFIINPVYSKINALFENSSRSKNRIQPFIDKYKINMSDYVDSEYASFNDFFIRIIKPESRVIGDGFISPCDSKLSVYKIDDRLNLKIKGSFYSVGELLQDDRIADNYRDGYCLVFRMTVDDYHRYCFVEDGDVMAKKRIAGKLHTVSHISNGYRIYSENQREYCIVRTKLGDMVQMEVGALQVGKINNRQSKKSVRGVEKGYFSFGGSTIIILVKSNKIKIDDDILKNSNDNIEVKVSYGETIGKIIC